MVDALAPHCRAETLITADAGYHSEANLEALAARRVEALIADGQMRKRDDRFATQARHRAAPDPLHNKTPTETTGVFQPRDFQFDAVARTCVCPAGKSLYRKGAQLATRGYLADRFQGAKRDCGPCPLRAQCLRTPEKTMVRQVAFFTGVTAARADTHTARMQHRIDQPAERARYARRFAVVEPVFANVCYNKGRCVDAATLLNRREMRQKPAHLLGAQVARMPALMKQNEATHPEHVRLFRAHAVAPLAQPLAHAI